jgi:hypothetical protein
MRIITHLGAIGALLLSASALAAPVPWAVLPPSSEPVRFGGVADMDDVGKPGAMMYTGPGLAGVLAAVATHGIIVGAMHKSQKNEIRLAADQVVAPYAASLATFSQRDLLHAASSLANSGAPRWLDAAESADDISILSNAATFEMTQDRSTLILQSEVNVTRPGKQPPYSNVIRVVGHPHSRDDLATYWGADEAKALKDESARLLALSIDIALSEAHGSSDAGAGPQRTVRFREGNREVFERATVIGEQCDRLLIRNLRGWIMSVPRSKPDCARP